MNLNLVKGAKATRVSGPVAAGVTNVVGPTIDMLGFETIAVLLDVGALTATQVTGIKFQGGNLANGADAADLAGTKVLFLDTESNTTMLAECVRPPFRYITPVILRGTANAVINYAAAIQSHGHRQPVVQDASVTHVGLTVSPALGTP
jgi:hypothetical protein